MYTLIMTTITAHTHATRMRNQLYPSVGIVAFVSERDGRTGPRAEGEEDGGGRPRGRCGERDASDDRARDGAEGAARGGVWRGGRREEEEEETSACLLRF